MRLLAGLLCTVVLVTGCSAGSNSTENSADYTQAVAQWRNTTLIPAVQEAKAAQFSDVVVVGRRETAREQAVQKARCAAIGEARQAVDALEAPALKGSGSAEAEALSERLAAETTAYREEVVRALTELAHYCAYYADELSLSGRIIVAERALRRTLTQPGVLARSTRTDGPRVITTTVTCGAPRGCIPGQDQLPAYLAAYERARIDLVRKKHRLLGGISTPCRLSDYDRLCAFHVKGMSELLSAYRRVYEIVRDASTTVANPAIDQANAKATAAQRRFNARYAALYRKTFPNAPVQTEDYVTQVDIALLRRYEKAVRAAEVPSTRVPAFRSEPQT